MNRLSWSQTKKKIIELHKFLDQTTRQEERLKISSQLAKLICSGGYIDNSNLQSFNFDKYHI